MYNGCLESSFSSLKFAEPFVIRRSRAGELLHVGRWRRRLVHAVAHRMRFEDDVSIMVYGRPDPSERKTRSDVRRVEVSNQQQTTNYNDHHEKASVGRGCSDRAVSRDMAERETVGQVRSALRELRRQEEELQPERKKLLPPGWKRIRAEEIKELALERNISMTGPDGKRQVKEALIRDLLRWCERQTEPETAPFGACAADVPITRAAESAQSRTNSWRRRLWTEEDVFVTPTGRRR